LPAIQPLVSICIPACNSESFVAASVESALEQDYPNLEVVVTDDSSQDGTVEVLQDRFGDSIRLQRNEVRMGPPRTAMATVARSRGSLIKFLHHDDRLARDCVSKMVAALGRHDSAGMVFSRRRVEAEFDTPAARAWIQKYGELHSGFSSVKPLNHGMALLREIVVGGMQNWIGEPSCVMVRRLCLERLGGSNPHLYMLPDLELWMRIMTSYDVAFVDEELCTYRRSANSYTGYVVRGQMGWLDWLWIYDMLMDHAEVRRAVPELDPRWRFERRKAYRRVVRHALRPQPDDPPVGLLSAYISHRIRRRFGRSNAIQRI
jgi:glycosyltransferase involved in cell wall biosynthesis